MSLPAMHTNYPRTEPDDFWKAQTRRRIDDNLDQLLLDARRSYEEKVNATRPAEDSLRRRLYLDYLQAVQNLKAFARDEYNYAIERERQEMEWLAQSEAPVELDLDESLREEQFHMLNAFHLEVAKARAKADFIQNYREPEDDYETTPESSEPCESPERSEPGTPVVLPLDDQFRAHAEELSRLLSVTPSPSPMPSPCLSLSPPPPPSLELSPSPPSTPGLSSEDAGPSSTESSIIFIPERSVIDEEVRLRAEKHAEQQEEFRRRAEEIRKRNEEKKKQKQRAVEEAPAVEDVPRLTAPPAPSDAPPASSCLFSTGPSNPDDHQHRQPSLFLTRMPRTPPPRTARAIAPPPTPSSQASTSSAPVSPPLRPTYPSASHTFVSCLKLGMSEEDMIRLFIFHDQQWDRISSFTKLHWSDFPWPILSFTGPKTEKDLSYTAISDYILSAFDWEHERPRSKERLREHIKKWHPDRFESKFVSRVPEADGERERVRHAAGVVVRFLNELLGKFDDL